MLDGQQQGLAHGSGSFPEPVPFMTCCETARASQALSPLRYGKAKQAGH